MNFQNSSNLLYELNNIACHYLNMLPDYPHSSMLSEYPPLLNPQQLIAENIRLLEKENQLSNRIKQVENNNSQLLSTIKIMEDELKRYRKRRYSKKRLFIEPKYQCNSKDCQKSYRSKTALKNHIKRKHSKNQTKSQKTQNSSFQQ